MNTLQAYAELKKLGVPVLRTSEVTRRLRVPASTAHATLSRLEKAGLVTHMRRGSWLLEQGADRLSLPAYLTGRFPAYVSFETALFYHDMLQQIPPRVTVASLHRPTQIRTAAGTYEVHQLPPALFGGFEGHDGVQLATPEKALVDLAYVRAHKGWAHTRMPEIEVPSGFRPHEVAAWLARISNPKLQTMTRIVLERWGIPTGQPHDGQRSAGKTPPREGQATQSSRKTKARATIN